MKIKVLLVTVWVMWSNDAELYYNIIILCASHSGY